MIKKPLISVITPVYNREKFISFTIESILKQKYTNFEYILVNDGSTDNSMKIIRKFQKIDNRIKIIDHENNRGASQAYNTGVEVATGEYLARLDSDDIADPLRLKRQIQYLINNVDILAVGCGSLIINGKGETIGKKIFPKNYKKIIKLLNYTNPLFNSSIMINLNLINFNKKLIYLDPIMYPADDYYMWRKIIAKKFLISNIEEYLHIHRYHKAGESYILHSDQGLKTLLATKIISLDNSINFEPKYFIKGNEILFSNLPEYLRPSKIEYLFFSNLLIEKIGIIRSISIIINLIMIRSIQRNDFYLKKIIILNILKHLFSLFKRKYFN